MPRLRLPKLAVCIACAAFALMLACASAAFAPAAVAQDGASAERTPAELLEDGMDAAADNATSSARRLLGELIADYPNSPEASRARQTLADLDQDRDVNERAVIRADEAERTAKYRRAFLIDVGDRVFFAETSADLGWRGRYVVENQARWLKARPDLTVTVIGRADDGGDHEAAAALSQKRAEAVREGLVEAGLDAARITVKAAGDRDLPAACKTSLCRAENRNAEVLIDKWRYDSPWRVGQRTARPPVRGGSDGNAAQSRTTDQAPQ